MQASPYLFFNGNCEEAFRFYANLLGGKVEMIGRFRDSPMKDQMAEDWLDKVMHIQMKVGELVIMGCDAPPGHYEAAKGFYISLNVETPELAEGIFPALCNGGEIRMPIQDTFFARRFGMAVDRFGVPWMVNCPLPPKK
ncbi:MAG: VOC family protein [Pseudomonadota bacterium]|nr:VOC family protein [Pseudomonadota bacterium]